MISVWFRTRWLGRTVLPASLAVVAAGSLFAQAPAAVLIEADAPVAVVRASGARLAAPAPLLALGAGDSVVVGNEGFALILYPAGPAKVWPGEAHAVPEATAADVSPAGETLWRQISSTVAALVGAPEAQRAEARHGVSRTDGTSGIRLLVSDGATVLTTRPRFFLAMDEPTPAGATIEVVIFGELDARRCWRGGVAHWEGVGADSTITVGDAETELEAGAIYRIQATTPEGERDTVCFRVADPDTHARLRARRSRMTEELGDASESFDLLWSALLSGEGFDVDALDALHTVLEQQPTDPAAALLRAAVRERLLAGRP